MVAEALEELREYFSNEKQDKKILIAWNENWHVGILGLLAAKCVEKFMLPTIILQDLGDELVGSARSPEFFNMVDTLSKYGDLLENYGGHVQAAGFTIKKDKFPEFVEKVEAYAEDVVEHTDWHPTIEIDCELQQGEINDRLMKFIENLEPFGIGNEQPAFLIKNVAVDNVKRVGKEGNHLHFDVHLPTKRLSVIGFKLGEFEDYLNKNQVIDLVCHLERNEWKGNTKLQLRAVDFIKSE
jgi:single-stranded-DNA-specific exonuclease